MTMNEFRGIVETLERLREPAALATLVRVKGSSYRKPGARMVFGPEGTRQGLISAGCLETDVLARVESVLAGARPQLAVYDMGSDLDLVWGTGMGCEGKVEVLLERITGIQPWMTLCLRLLEERRSGVLATVFDTRGEGAGAAGQRFLYEAAGEGLLPADPELRAALQQEFPRVLQRGIAVPVTLRLRGVELDLLLEPILPPFALWIYGAGEHGRPIAHLAKALGWYVGVVDHRPALATSARFPGADRIVVGHPAESLPGLPFDGRSAALIISHVYEKDKEALAILLDAPCGYLGIQGNRKRCGRLLAEVGEARGPLDQAQSARLHAPAGLDLGSESPEAIALSMLAEIQAALTGFPGGHLRDRQGAIHA
jgi:xanthine dehydrogenase accessory factor